MISHRESSFLCDKNDRFVFIENTYVFLKEYRNNNKEQSYNRSREFFVEFSKKYNFSVVFLKRTYYNKKHRKC